MNKHNRWNVALISVATVIVLIGRTIAFAIADEKKEIPDHTNFETCPACHAEKQKMWEESGHGKAIGLVVIKRNGGTDCSSCHSAKNVEVKQDNAMAESANKEPFHKASCLACHSRQKSECEHRLVMEPEKLCTLCHSQRSVLLGEGAKGIEDIRNYHSGVPCVSCHMTEGNHRMKVLRPDDPGLTEKRLDTCTACHMDNNREARVRQIQEWQSTYEEEVTPVLADAKAMDAALKNNPSLLNAALKSKFDDLKANLSILEKDGSRGFHNLVFSLEVASLARADLKEIKAAMK